MKNLKIKIKLIGFDVNGTLFDDTIQFFNAINGIFSKFGKEPMPLDVLRKKFGQPWTKIYREAGIAEKMISDKELYVIYNELYNSQLPPKPFAGIRQILKWLCKRNTFIAVVSTQQNFITDPLLKKYGLDRFFSHLEGGVSDKTEAIKRVLMKFGVSAKQAAYVGDQEGDILHAKSAGVVSIGFYSGLHSLQRLRAAKPDFLVGEHQDLKNLPIF